MIWKERGCCSAFKRIMDWCYQESNLFLFPLWIAKIVPLTSSKKIPISTPRSVTENPKEKRVLGKKNEPRRERISGAPNDGFPSNTLKTLLRLSRVLLDLQKCILSGTIKIVSLRSSEGNFSLFKITRASVLFSRKF